MRADCLVLFSRPGSKHGWRGGPCRVHLEHQAYTTHRIFGWMMGHGTEASLCLLGRHDASDVIAHSRQRGHVKPCPIHVARPTKTPELLDPRFRLLIGSIGGTRSRRRH
nr:unnamed protein product [Digitaria exilis]